MLAELAPQDIQVTLSIIRLSRKRIVVIDPAVSADGGQQPSLDVLDAGQQVKTHWLGQIALRSVKQFLRFGELLIANEAFGLDAQHGSLEAAFAELAREADRRPNRFRMLIGQRQALDLVVGCIVGQVTKTLSGVL